MRRTIPAMTDGAWATLAAMLRVKWPKLANEIMPPGKADETPEERDARLTFGRAFRDTVRSFPLDAEQIKACLVALNSRSKWAPKEAELVEALRRAAYGEQQERAVHELRHEPVERTPCPWVLYGTDPDAAVALYPWLLEPWVSDRTGERWERAIDHPLYADAARRRVQAKQERDLHEKREADRKSRIEAAAAKSQGRREAVSLGDALRSQR